MAKVTDATLKKAIKERCKDCCPDGKDKELCKKCPMAAPTNIRRAIMKYCKECRNGMEFEVCVSKDCALYVHMPELLKEAADTLKANLSKAKESK